MVTIFKNLCDQRWKPGPIQFTSILDAYSIHFWEYRTYWYADQFWYLPTLHPELPPENPVCTPKYALWLVDLPRVVQNRAEGSRIAASDWLSMQATLHNLRVIGANSWSMLPTWFHWRRASDLVCNLLKIKTSVDNFMGHRCTFLCTQSDVISLVGSARFWSAIYLCFQEFVVIVKHKHYYKTLLGPKNTGEPRFKSLWILFKKLHISLQNLTGALAPFAPLWIRPWGVEGPKWILWLIWATWSFLLMRLRLMIHFTWSYRVDYSLLIFL